MKFRLIATSMPYTFRNAETEVKYLEKYIEKIKNADAALDLPEPFIDGQHVYIQLMYGSQFLNLAKTLEQELIVCYGEEEPTIEIYDDWRE